MPDDIKRMAVISEDGTYRYSLIRRWSNGPLLNWIMLNPSTADSVQDDPTIRRVMRFTRDWGRAGCWITNLFALRSTDPAALATHDDPIGDECTDHIRLAAEHSPYVLCAWGAAPVARERAEQVSRLLLADGRDLRCLGVTGTEAPKHPLYLAANTVPVAFRPSRKDVRT